MKASEAKMQELQQIETEIELRAKIKANLDEEIQQRQQYHGALEVESIKQLSELNKQQQNLTDSITQLKYELDIQRFHVQLLEEKKQQQAREQQARAREQQQAQAREQNESKVKSETNMSDPLHFPVCPSLEIQSLKARLQLFSYDLIFALCLSLGLICSVVFALKKCQRSSSMCLQFSPNLSLTDEVTFAIGAEESTSHGHLKLQGLKQEQAMSLFNQLCRSHETGVVWMASTRCKTVEKCTDLSSKVELRITC